MRAGLGRMRYLACACRQGAWVRRAAAKTARRAQRRRTCCSHRSSSPYTRFCSLICLVMMYVPTCVVENAPTKIGMIQLEHLLIHYCNDMVQGGDTLTEKGDRILIWIGVQTT